MKDEILTQLYKKTGRHSQYQKIPDVLEQYIDTEMLAVHSRYEDERFDYILRKISVRGKKILDIGGNTGYFTFRAAGAGALHVDYYEGNKDHALFVERAAQLTGLNTAINIHPEYYSFPGVFAGRCDFAVEDPDHSREYDICFLMNVLHHTGMDFDEGDIDIDTAGKRITDSLNAMSERADIIVFQTGFNLQGDITKPLFENGTKREMIDSIRRNCSGCWDILSIGIAERRGDAVRYEDLNEKNEERDDSLGEFLNRPLFIMKSKSSGHEKNA